MSASQDDSRHEGRSPFGCNITEDHIVRSSQPHPHTPRQPPTPRPKLRIVLRSRRRWEVKTIRFRSPRLSHSVCFGSPRAFAKNQASAEPRANARAAQRGLNSAPRGTIAQNRATKMSV